MKRNWKKFAGIVCTGSILLASCFGVLNTVNVKANSGMEYEAQNEDVMRGATSCPGEIDVTIRFGFLNADGSYNQTYDSEKYPFECTYGDWHSSGANHANRLKEFHPDNLKRMGVDLPDESKYEWKGYVKSDFAVVSKSEMQNCNPTFYTFTSASVGWAGLKNHYFYLIYEEVEPETQPPETTVEETTEEETLPPETTVEETTTEEETLPPETTVEETTTEEETLSAENTTEEESTVEETTASNDNTSANTADFSALPFWISALTVSGGTIGMFGYRKNRKR